MTRRLAFLGPRGTNAEEAALRYDPSAELVPFPGISAVAAAVDSGMADGGVVPIENSLEGAVTETLDVLIHDAKLAICIELVLPIEHFLLAKPGLKAADVRRVYSHPQALAQCRGFIERCFPKAEMVAALSTAAAVEEMMQRDDSAAVGNKRAAEIYGAEVLARDIQERRGNVTRFVVLAANDHPPTGSDKTSLAFAFAVEDRPGLLVGALEEFSSRGINLSKIESRPSGDRLGTYIFLADVDGHRTDPALAEALERIQEQCSYFRILGSYPRYQKSG
ncbi:MAG: prephenate dehydratase [Chloroflexi bacterium]|nr:prephenate dehydratase [Chloroflexota bacterium]